MFSDPLSPWEQQVLTRGWGPRRGSWLPGWENLRAKWAVSLPPQPSDLPCTLLGSLGLCLGLSSHAEGLQGLHQQPGEASSQCGWLQAHQATKDHMLVPQANPNPGSKEPCYCLGAQIRQNLLEVHGQAL